ncbi:MAG: transposase [bacterium]
MARPWRIQYEGAIYHVMSRGIERGTIFLTEEDYLRFLECLERAVEKFQLEIFAFVLMGNHYHLLLRTPQANLSRAMQWLKTAYSVYYNLRHQRCGHLFQG